MHGMEYMKFLSFSSSQMAETSLHKYLWFYVFYLLSDSGPLEGAETRSNPYYTIKD